MLKIPRTEYLRYLLGRANFHLGCIFPTLPAEIWNYVCSNEAFREITPASIHEISPGGYFLSPANVWRGHTPTHSHARAYIFTYGSSYTRRRNTRRNTGRTSEADTWKRYGKVGRVNLKLVAGCGLWMLDRNSWYVLVSPSNLRISPRVCSVFCVLSLSLFLFLVGPSSV